MRGTLVLSANRGRYAIGDPESGPDLSSGTAIDIHIGGRWVPGSIEYASASIYAAPGPQTLAEVAQMTTRPKAIPGYYFIAATGEVVGLCVGMEVRIS